MPFISLICNVQTSLAGGVRKGRVAKLMNPQLRGTVESIMTRSDQRVLLSCCLVRGSESSLSNQVERCIYIVLPKNEPLPPWWGGAKFQKCRASGAGTP